MNLAPLATWALATWPPADESPPPEHHVGVTYLVATVVARGVDPRAATAVARGADPRAAVVGGRANRVDPTRTDVRPR